MRAAIFGLALGIFVSTATPASAVDVPGLAATGGRITDNTGPWTLGFDFTASSAFTLSALGVFDAGGDGLSSSHQVGIWNSAGTLITSVNVLSGTSGTLIDGFRYADIGSILLGPGTYRIGAADLGVGDAYRADAIVTAAPGFTYSSARFQAGSGLLRPDTNGELGGYFGANFLFEISSAVPEPSTWAMMLLGFGGIGAAIRRRPKSARAAHA